MPYKHELQNRALPWDGRKQHEHRLTGWDQFLAVAVEVGSPAIGVGVAHKQHPAAVVLVGPQTHRQEEYREKPIPGTFLGLISSGLTRAMLLSREQVCPGKGHPSDAVPHSSKCGGSRWGREDPKTTRGPCLGLNYPSSVRKEDG